MYIKYIIDYVYMNISLHYVYYIYVYLFAYFVDGRYLWHKWLNHAIRSHKDMKSVLILRPKCKQPAVLKAGFLFLQTSCKWHESIKKL